MSILVDDKYLGHATAYAYAKSKGYTGTEEEFAELMASYATVAEAAEASAQAAAQSATAASGSASAASTSAGTATTKAEEASQSATNAQQYATNANQSATQASGSATTAQGAAQTATAKANEASASAAAALQQAQNAMTHASNAQTFANNAQTSATQAAASANTANDSANLAVEAAEEATTTVANKADKDGIYSDLSVGNVFSDDSYTEDKTPYLYRVSGGGVEVGKVEADKIVGGTIAWNQQVPINETTRTVADVEITSNNDGTYTLNGTATAIAANYWFSSGSYNTIQNHIMLLKDVVIVSSSGLSTRFSSQLGGIKLYKCEYSEKVSFRMPNFQNGQTYSNVKVVPQLFDLTQMFGSTIADYIYTLGQTTGVAFFRKMFPNAYYPYNTGELMHVSGVSEHVMTWKNLFNPNSAGHEWVRFGSNVITTDLKDVISNRFIAKSGDVFTLSNANASTSSNILMLSFLDANDIVLSRNVVSTGAKSITATAPANTVSVLASFYVNYLATDKQLEIGSTATAYEPYKTYTYPLDSSLTLRGIPKLDANNNLYYDGDVYTADGKVQRKYGIVDLGTLTWQKFSVTQGTLFRTTISTSADNDTTISANVICAKYPTVAQTSRAEKTLSCIGHLFDIIDSSYTTEQDFKTAMSGVYLVYELATPTTEEAEPYTEYQKVSAYGTEEYVSTSIVPVGHVTKYPADIVSKVDGLPSDFSTLIAPTEKGFTATRAYTVNELLIVNNTLYKVTSAIANGAAITVGTNVQQTTLSALIKALSA